MPTPHNALRAFPSPPIVFSWTRREFQIRFQIDWIEQSMCVCGLTPGAHAITIYMNEKTKKFNWKKNHRNLSDDYFNFVATDCINDIDSLCISHSLGLFGNKHVRCVCDRLVFFFLIVFDHVRHGFLQLCCRVRNGFRNYAKQHKNQTKKSKIALFRWKRKKQRIELSWYSCISGTVFFREQCGRTVQPSTFPHTLCVGVCLCVCIANRSFWISRL